MKSFSKINQLRNQPYDISSINEVCRSSDLSLTHSCPVCASSGFEIFFELNKMPVFCNLLWKDRQAAQNCSQGDIKLAFCPECGFIGNAVFDPEKLEYTEDYECSLDFSPRFQSYAQSLANNLIERHDLHDKKIIEIGSGKGDFLILLCEKGDNYGVGFDPTYVYRPEHERYQIDFVRDYYSEDYAQYQGDFIICRHTLEHIPHPTDFLTILRKNIGTNSQTKIFFEVPNALDTFNNLAVWDIIYEHCCYFSPVSLTNAFSICGFQVADTREEYRGQFLCLEAIPTDERNQKIAQTEALLQLKQDIAEFDRKFQQKVSYWNDKLAEIARRDRKVVLWGAGSKGVTFLNILQEQNNIEYVVDINPNKKGKYIPGTGQQIVAPEFLTHYQPDIVIIMNPIYEHEITKTLEAVKCNAKVITSI